VKKVTTIGQKRIVSMLKWWWRNPICG